eukprot:10454156-Alexandrium_andersonii.AAC.1
MQEVRPSGHLRLVQLGDEPEVRACLAYPALHLIRIHAGVVDVHVQRAPVGTRRAADQEVRLAGGDRPDGLFPVLRL